METLINLDSALFSLLNVKIGNPTLDRVFTVLTQLRFFIPFMIAGAIYLLFYCGRKGRIALVSMLVAVGVADLISHELIKPLVGRLRPCVALEGVRMVIGKKTSLSFPSNHAANITAAACVMAFYYRRALGPAIAIAVLVAFSRVYTGVHYPSDVIAGAVLGGGIAALTLWRMQKLAFVEAKDRCGKPADVDEPESDQVADPGEEAPPGELFT